MQLVPLQHGSLPAEAVCTENVTPWIKLLPCRDQAGVGALLRSRPTIFGGNYVSFSTRVRVVRRRRTTTKRAGGGGGGGGGGAGGGGGGGGVGAKLGKVNIRWDEDEDDSDSDGGGGGGGRGGKGGGGGGAVQVNTKP
jgi:hypothetical protein